MSEMEAQQTVFLSFATQDSKAAESVEKALNQAGFKVSSGISAPIISDLSKLLREAILTNDAFVMVVSGQSALSPSTAFEVGAALAWGKQIYLVKAGDGLLPEYLSKLQAFSIKSLPLLVAAMRRNNQPLGSAQQKALISAYTELGISTDRLALDPNATIHLRDLFQKKSNLAMDADRLLRELLFLRKSGKLAKLTKVSHGNVIKQPA